MTDDITGDPATYTHGDVEFLLVHMGVQYSKDELVASRLTGADVRDGLTGDALGMLKIALGGGVFAVNGFIKRARERAQQGMGAECCADHFSR